MRAPRRARRAGVRHAACRRPAAHRGHHGGQPAAPGLDLALGALRLARDSSWGCCWPRWPWPRRRCRCRFCHRAPRCRSPTAPTSRPWRCCRRSRPRSSWRPARGASACSTRPAGRPPTAPSSASPTWWCPAQAGGHGRRAGRRVRHEQRAGARQPDAGGSHGVLPLQQHPDVAGGRQHGRQLGVGVVARAVPVERAGVLHRRGGRQRRRVPGRQRLQRRRPPRPASARTSST